MKDALTNENSWIVDRSWQKVNPTAQLTIPLTKAAEFLKLLTDQHAVLKSMNAQQPPTSLPAAKTEEKIHNFILKFIQQKELNVPIKREMPFVRESNYQFDLRDCLEIWRWLSEDENYHSSKELPYDESMVVNEFDLNPTANPHETKRNFDESNRNKKLFNELSM